jgi:hypothetical protein
MARSKSPSLAQRLIAEVGVTKSHAYMIQSGDRTPSLPLALRIFEKTKLQLGPLAGASSAEIKALAKVSERAA